MSLTNNNDTCRLNKCYSYSNYLEFWHGVGGWCWNCVWQSPLWIWQQQLHPATQTLSLIPKWGSMNRVLSHLLFPRPCLVLQVSFFFFSVDKFAEENFNFLCLLGLPNITNIYLSNSNYKLNTHGYCQKYLQVLFFWYKWASLPL